MHADHGRWADAAGSYLLGALPEDEHEAYEAHLIACAECREEIDDLAPAAHALPASVAPVTPPPALKARIMAEVEREASLLAAAGPEADRVSAPPARRRRRWSLALPRLAPIATAAALLIIGAGAGIGALQLGDDGTRTVVATVDTARAPEAGAELERDGRSATLVAYNLPAPPAGRVYQVWLKRSGQRAPEPTSVLFTPNGDGEATASVPGDLDAVDAVMVTDEPAGGSTRPTRTPLLVADLS